uniref:Uncharacterized protein n=1 Tax=Anguilla anguilla TaxID=7936 RepID=A0A0E9TEL6_ANGAN
MFFWSVGTTFLPYFNISNHLKGSRALLHKFLSAELHNIT